MEGELGQLLVPGEVADGGILVGFGAERGCSRIGGKQRAVFRRIAVDASLQLLMHRLWEAGGVKRAGRGAVALAD